MTFIDFDGTLVDLWPRYWSVFKDILKIDISLEDYKKAKQKYIKDAIVAEFFKIKLPSDFFQRKATELENRSFLEMDRLLVDRNELNYILQQECAILTKRRNIDNFYWQLSALGINSESYVVRDMSKKKWVEQSEIKADLIIGDSISDLEVANTPGVEAWMVGYGLNTKYQFDSMGVSYRYIKSPDELISLLRDKVIRNTRRKER